MKKLFGLCLIAAVAGCSGDSNSRDTLMGYYPTIDEPREFILPSGDGSIEITQVPGARFGEYQSSAYEHPNKWVVYMATASWVSKGSIPIHSRRGVDETSGIAFMQFLEGNDLKDQVDFVWLQYDGLPRSRAEGWGGFGVREALPNMIGLRSSRHIFDAYVISPVARYPGGQTISYPEWIRPLLNYSGPYGDQNLSEDKRRGLDDPGSEFWDAWNPHFFVVDPDGMVRDAYVNVGFANRVAYIGHAMRSVAHHLDLDQDALHIPDHPLRNGYRSYYSPTLEAQFTGR